MTIKVTIPNTSSDSLTFGSSNTPTAAQVVGIDSGSSNGQLAFNTTASGTSTERMRIDTSGNVGIGTNSPNVRLELSRSGGVTLRLNDTTTNYWDIANNSNLLFSRGGTEYARIDSSGNFLVGGTSVIATGNGTGISVGTVSGGMQLSTGGTVGYIGHIFPSARGIEHVNTASAGSPRPYFFTTQGGAAYTSINASAFNVNSDYRLKENISPISGALSRVNLLKPSRFNYKSDIETAMPFGTDTVDGFIAHEVQSVVPEAVYGEKDAINGDGKILPQSLDASKLIPLLTAAIQEQQAQIVSLQDTVTSQAEALASLTTRLVALEAK